MTRIVATRNVGDFGGTHGAAQGEKRAPPPSTTVRRLPCRSEIPAPDSTWLSTVVPSLN